MSEIVEKYLAQEKEKYKNTQKQMREDTLIELGLFEKRFTISVFSSEEYPFFDDIEKKHYAKIPIEISDDEYEEIIKFHKLNSDLLKSEEKDIENVLDQEKGRMNITNYLYGVGIIIILLGVICGFYLKDETKDLSVSFGIWGIFCALGILIVAFSKIIEVFDFIKDKK